MWSKRFLARFCCPEKSRKCPCCNGFRALTVPVVDTRRIAPKPPALPTALIPVFQFFRFQEVFLSVVIYVVKPVFCPSFTGEIKNSNLSVPTGSAVSPFEVLDTLPKLPNLPHYQPRYTRLLSFHPAGVFSQTHTATRAKYGPGCLLTHIILLIYAAKSSTFPDMYHFPASKRQTLTPASAMANTNQNIHMTLG